MNIMPFKSFLSLGNPEELKDDSKPVGEDIAILMYTSGSTGKPKGVEITHRNIFYALVSISIQRKLCKKEVYIAFLPLAHILELVSEISLISFGVSIAYSSPNTITNNSSKIAKGTIGDARVAKPTAMTAVPLILDRIIKSVTQNVEKQGPLSTKIFKKALRIKQRNYSSIASRVLDKVIFNKVKAELGGSLRFIAIGGAPLSQQTKLKMNAIFGCNIQVGYGCTETTASLTSMDTDDIRVGHVGYPNPFMMVKLEDWLEGNYRTTDQPRPRGEIIAGGPCVTKGYFKLAEETKESFYMEDGVQWFRTGDIGEIDGTGVLYIIDRKKDLVKLKHGEFVSLGNIESIIKTCNMIENICVFANSNEGYTVAIIVPSVSSLRKIADDVGLSDESSIDKLYIDTKVVKAFLEKIRSYGKRKGLSRWDIPQAIFLTSLAWTPENGLVTASLKLKRKAIQKEYEEQIKNMYK
ncbi:UNVERIFIED_CONTAM: hypothetical protein GTU68_022259 [Idotea baltica]|nr:hypothetical protein [Idotea baltica]